MREHGHLYVIQWSPYRKDEPPNGMARVQFKGFALSTHPMHKPPEVQAFFAQYGYGNGWVCAVRAVEPPPRRRSEESRGKTRVKNLERRVAKTIGPLFAAEVVQEEIQQQPEYFSGKSDPEHDAYIKMVDSEDARLWTEFCAWADQQTTHEPVRGAR